MSKSRKSPASNSNHPSISKTPTRNLNNKNALFKSALPSTSEFMRATEEKSSESQINLTSVAASQDRELHMEALQVVRTSNVKPSKRTKSRTPRTPHGASMDKQRFIKKDQRD